MFSFRKRRKHIDPAPFLRRVIDRTTVAATRLSEDRLQNRYSRSLPLMLAPWIDGAVDLTQVTFGITKDISDTGIAVLTTTGFQSDVIFSLLIDREISDRILCFRGEIRRELKLIEGIFEYGFQVAELLKEDQGVSIEPFVSLVNDSKENRQSVDYAAIS